IILSNGHIWKQQRRFGVVTLRKLGLGKKGVEHQIEEEAQQLVETFAREKGQPFDPSFPVVNSVSNIICAMTFGHRFSLQDKNFQKLVAAVDSIFTFAGSFFHFAYEMFPWLMKHLPGPHQKALSDMETMLSFAREETKKHKEQQSFHEPRDFIDFYLLEMEKNKNDPDSAFNEENLAHCIHDFFIAGTETTASSLKWALLLLTNHPVIQDKVHKELEEVLGSSQLISYRDLKRLPYTNAVIHEMQRVKYVLVLGVPRQCAQDVNMRGFLIPKGTLIMANLRSVLLDPKQWEAPEEFNPNHFLDKDGNFVAREAYLPFGAGIAFSNGHIWKQQRRFSLVTLRKLGLGKKGMERQIEEEALQLVETFAHAKGQPFDPTTPIVKSVSNVICALTFGHRFSLEDKNFQSLTEAADNTLRFLGSFSHTLYEMFPWLMKHLPGPHKKTISYIEEMFSFARKEIKNHKEQQSLHDPQDFINFYLLEMEKSKNDLDSVFHEENLIQCIHDFFLAGSDTTVLSLKWALLLLTSHPDIQEKVHKELEDVLGSSQLISYQDVKRLPYTNAVIHEMQRFRFISLIGVPRQCRKDVNMHGFLIPKGTLILPNLRSVLLDPEQWETPEQFDPNHFLDKDGNFVAREAYMPFGAGARACPGEQLARTEIFIFLTSLLRTFRFQLPEGVEDLSQDPVQGMTTPPHPYKICAVPRSNSV
ncbi:hypothetical protein JRQ81_017714, partial [Phrynocephalus forsythii]